MDGDGELISFLGMVLVWRRSGSMIRNGVLRLPYRGGGKMRVGIPLFPHRDDIIEKFRQARYDYHENRIPRRDENTGILQHPSSSVFIS